MIRITVLKSEFSLEHGLHELFEVGRDVVCVVLVNARVLGGFHLPLVDVPVTVADHSGPAVIVDIVGLHDWNHLGTQLLDAHLLSLLQVLIRPWSEEARIENYSALVDQGVKCENLDKQD